MRRFLPTTLRQRLLLPVLAVALVTAIALGTAFRHELVTRLAPFGHGHDDAVLAVLAWEMAFGALVGVGLWRVFDRILFRPVDALLRTVRALATGDLAARTGIAPERRGDLAELARALDDLAAQLEMRRRHQASADEALRQSEARKAVIVAESRDGIVTFDAGGLVLECNPAAERMFGVPARAVLGRDISDFLLPLEWRGERPGAVAIETRTFETRALRADLSDFPCEVRVASASTASGERLYTAYVRDLTARRRYEQVLRDLSFLDDLTGLNNRRGFLRFAEQQLRLADRSRSSTTLVFADLDGLKSINDTHGHEAGDRAIVAVADALRQAFRQSDVLGRIGGDEFVVLATESGGEGRSHLVQRLRTVLAAHSRRLGLPLVVSAGIVRRPPGARASIASMLTRADARMYAEKRDRMGGSRAAPAAAHVDSAA